MKNTYVKSNWLNRYWTENWEKTKVEEELQTLKRDPIRGLVLEYLPRKGKVLEAGCGLGRYVFYLSSQNYDIFGADYSKRAINFCRQYARKIKYDPNRFIVADITKLPFPDDYFSGYLSFGVIEHFQEGPQAAIKEAYRVLKKGGVIILTTPNRYALFRNLKRIRNHFLFQGKFFQYEYSIGQLKRFLRRENFQVILKTNYDLKGAIPEFLKFLPLSAKIQQMIFSVIAPVAQKLEKTPLVFFGGISLVVARKR